MSTQPAAAVNIYQGTKVSYNPEPNDGKAAPSPFVSFLKRIWKAIKWVFKQIGDFFNRLFAPKNNNLTLEKHEVEMIKKAQLIHPPKPPSTLEGKTVTQADALTDLSTKPKKNQAPNKLLEAMDLASSTATLAQKSTKAKKPEEEKLPPITDPVMKEFHETTQKFVETLLDTIVEKKIQPHLVNFKDGLEGFSKTLKIGADLAFKIGDKTAKPLFDKLKQFSIDETSEFQNILKWLLKDGAPEGFAEKLEQAVAENFDNPASAKAFVAPCLSWLLKTDHKKDLMDVYKEAGFPEKANKEKINKVFEAAILLLLDKKISHFMGSCQEKLAGKIVQSVRNLVVENGKKMSDVLARRIIDLLENAEFPKMFDTLVKVGLDQTGAIAAVEKAKEKEFAAQKALLEKAKLAHEHPTQFQDKKVQAELAAHYLMVKEVGEAKWIEQQAELKGAEAYAAFGTNGGTAEGICHKSIAQLLQNPNMSPAEKKKIEEELFDNLAEGLIPLLLPTQKIQLPNGDIQEVDSLVYMCSLIELPEEIKEIAKEAIEISKEIITPETQKVIKGIYDTAWSFAGDHIQESIVAEVKKILKIGVKIGARSLFEKFITPSNIDGMVSFEVLPNIQGQLFVNFGREYLQQNQSKFIPQFHKLTGFDVSENRKRNEVIDEICQAIHAEVKKKAIHSHKEFDALGYKRFKELLLPQINAMEAGIRAYQEAKKDKSPESVAVALQGFYMNFGQVSANPHFGELISNLLFKIGNFGGAAEFFSDWFKGIISEEISSATNNLRVSPHFLIDKATKEIQARCSDKKAMEQLIFEDQVEMAKPALEDKLQTEIDKTAKVAMDLVDQKVEELNWAKKIIAKPIVSSMLGSDQKVLANLISKVYKKMFSNRLMTHNLLVRSQEQVLKYLTAASDKLEAKGGKPIKAAKIPGIIPELFATA